MPDPVEQDLHAEIARLNKIIQALMDRAENSASIQGSDFNLFQTTITLEDQVRRRTEEMEAALRENEKITRALRESENHNRLLVENSPMCIHEIDLNGKITSMNRAGLCMLGLKEEREVQGLLYLNAVSDAEREHIGALLTQAYAGEVSHFEFKASGPSEKVYKSCFVPIRNKNGGVEKLMGITEDVTEHNKSDEVLNKIQRLLNETEQIGKVGGWEFSIDTGRLTWTKEIYNIHEVDINFELTVEKAINFYAPASRPIIERAVNRAIEHGEAFDVELEIITAKGNTRNVHAIGKADLEHQRVYGFFQDITERKQIEEALRQSEQRFRSYFDLPLIGIAVTSLEKGWLEVNQRLCEIFGYPREELVRLTWVDITHPDDITRDVAEFERVLHGEIEGYSLDKRFVRKDGSIIHASISARCVRKNDGQIDYFVALVQDITDRNRAEENLRITASVFDNSYEAIVITDANNVFLDVNPAFTKITGYTREEVIGKNPKVLGSGRQDKAFYAAMWQSLEQNRGWRGEIWNRRKSGEVYAELLSIAAICDDEGRVQRYVGVFSDISYLKTHEAELSQVANYDALTGIPNRRLLADRMDQAIARAQRSGRMLSVCYIDLDGFKQVNDQYGHEVGDQLLVEVTRRLQEALRAGDTLARLGGDEFVVLFNDLASEHECLQILDRILDIVAMPVVFGNHAVAVSASVGVTFHTSANEDGDTLLRQADQAMYIAKQTGKSRYHLYASERG